MNLTSKIKKGEKRPYQICKRCVMDTSDPWIEFDSDGICNHCKTYFKKRFMPIKADKINKKSLEDLFKEIKKNKKSKSKYDVVTGISGGTDSSYVTYLAHKAGLKVLAVHVDNCWDTPTAIKNINKLISLDNVDYCSEVLNWNTFKNVQKIFIESGLPDIELPTDSALAAVIPRTAVKYGVKAILSGGNYSSEGILPSSWMYNPKDSLFLKSIFRESGKSFNLFERIHFGFRDDMKYRFFYKLKTYYPLNTFNYDKENAKKVLKQAINWESFEGKHCESIYTKFCQLIYQPKRHGIDYRRPLLATNICNSKITRKDAITILEEPPWEDLNVENELSFISNKLGYELSELKELMKKKPSWYKDYFNNEFFLNKIYNFYRLINGKPLSNSWWG